MRTSIIFIILTSVFVIVSTTSSFSQKVKKGKKVLIYTKNGEGYVHENIPYSVKAIRKILMDNGYVVDDTDDPSVFVEKNLQQYAVLVFSNTNNEGFDTDAQRLAFQRYIQAGGGFVGIHSANASERQWPWYARMVGGKFVRHPKFQKFDVRVIDNDHASTDFLPMVWHWEDECYYMDHLNPDIHILLAADLRTVEDDKKAEYPGVVFGNYFPLCWYHTFDGGREWYTALGHKPEHYDNPVLMRHIYEGILWAMKGSKYFDYTNATKELKME